MIAYPLILSTVIQLQLQFLFINFSLFISYIEIQITLQVLQLAKRIDKN